MARRLELDRAIDLFLDHCKVERGLSPNTLDSYARDLARLARGLVDRGRGFVDEITPLDLTEHLITLAAERVGLPAADVNLNQGFVRVTGKGRKTRLVPMHADAQGAIARYLREVRPAWLRDPAQRALFLTERGGPMTRQGFWKLLGKYA